MGEADTVVVIPPDVRAQLRDFKRARIGVFYNSADEQSRVIGTMSSPWPPSTMARTSFTLTLASRARKS